MISVPVELQKQPVTGSGMERRTVTVAVWAPDCWSRRRFLQGLKSMSRADNLPTLGPRSVQRRGRVERKLWTTQKSLATTSYSWVLALQPHYAGKCSFSFGDYKTHVPEGGKNTTILSSKNKTEHFVGTLYMPSPTLCA